MPEDVFGGSESTDSVKLCWQCGRRVEGELEGVPLTICCLKCCRRFIADPRGYYAGMHRESRSKALKRPYAKTYLDNIASLNYRSCDIVNDHYREFGLKLYLGAEARAWGHHRIGVFPFRDAAISKKLRSTFGIDVDQHDACICAIAAGGSISWDRKPLQDMDEAKRRFSVLNRVESMHSNCPSAHPEALFDFCLEHPGGQLADFLALKERIVRVFQLESNRILQFLTRRERALLVGTPLEDVALNFTQPDKEPGILACLKRRYSDAEAKEILAHPACQLRIQRCKNELETAQKLYAFWETRGNTILREENLMEVLSEHDLNIPEDSMEWRYCAHYINGDVDCDVEEVRGVIMINILLDEKEVDFLDQRVAIGTSKFEELYIEEGHAWEESLNEAVQAARVVLQALLEDKKSWDYHQLTQGYWANVFA